jgi:hypothetical protein
MGRVDDLMVRPKPLVDVAEEVSLRLSMKMQSRFIE